MSLCLWFHSLSSFLKKHVWSWVPQHIIPSLHFIELCTVCFPRNIPSFIFIFQCQYFNNKIVFAHKLQIGCVGSVAGDERSTNSSAISPELRQDATTAGPSTCPLRPDTQHLVLSTQASGSNQHPTAVEGTTRAGSCLSCSTYPRATTHYRR